MNNDLYITNLKKNYNNFKIYKILKYVPFSNFRIKKDLSGNKIFIVKYSTDLPINRIYIGEKTTIKCIRINIAIRNLMVSRYSLFMLKRMLNLVSVH